MKELDENIIAEIVEPGDASKLEAEVEETSMLYTDMRMIIEDLKDELTKFAMQGRSENKGMRGRLDQQ